jgi:outer membrane protein insertion porin family
MVRSVSWAPAWLGLVLLVVNPGRAGAAVADYIGKPIAVVRITIEDRETTDPTVTQIVETAVGQPLSMAQVRESLTHLYSLGRFDDVRVDAALDNGRVVLHYDLSPIHPVAEIRFEGTGAPGIDSGELRRALTDRFGSTPPLARVAEMARLVEAALGDRGYLRAAAEPRVDLSHSPERATLVFSLRPNNRAVVGTVEIVGTPMAPPEQLRGDLKLTAGAPYQRDVLNTRIERLLASRRKRGYYEARIVPTVTLADDDRVANIVLTVDQGPHVRVVFAGDPLPQAQQQAFVPIEREGSADEDLLEDSSHRIEEYFQAEGYRDASAPHSRESTNGELLITFTITRGPLYKVSEYDVVGNTSVSIDELATRVHVAVGQPFGAGRLDADISAIEALYRQRGYASVRAQPSLRIGAVDPTGVVPVAISIAILEGRRTLIDRIGYAGNPSVDPGNLRAVTSSQAGQPYVPSQVTRDRDAIQALYQDRGYINATVAIKTEPTADESTVAVVFQVAEGPQVMVDHVLIVGNVRTRTETIERELQIKPQEPFSLSAINESQRRLASLGLFRRARITEIGHGSETTRDLLVTVEEAPPTTIGYGAGVEGRRVVAGTDENGNARDQYDVAPRALFEVSRRNLFGRNRSASLFTSVSRSVRYSLTEYRVLATFREPHLLNTPADAFITASLEQQHRSSFDFSRRSISANLQRRFDSPYSAIGTYLLQRTRVFNQQATGNDIILIQRAFPTFLLSSFIGTLIRDTRDDQVDATDGTFASATAQMAGSAIGSEFSFIKSSITGQVFHRIAGTNQVVFAGNARLGVARGFTAVPDPSGLAQEGPLPASERFFAGGDSTQRAFAVDQLGVRHTPPQPGDTIDPDGFATGGNALVLFNGELRVPVTSAVGVVGFVDTGNVFARAADVAFEEFRTAVGAGLRYKSPLGPLRFDFGVNVNRQPGEKRTAWFVNFGQAF